MRGRDKKENESGNKEELAESESEKEIDNNACISLDIFQKEYSFSPAAFKRKVDALTASCEEIALRWDTI